MDERVKGIVLRARDYKESDKILTLLTFEKGKISVKARGAKKAKSKLKAFCQPFCFADFELVDSKIMPILSGANAIDMYFDLVVDYDKYALSSSVLEICDKICVEGQDYSSLLLTSIKCINEIAYTTTSPKLLIAKFIIEVLKEEGVIFSFNSCCNTCGKELLDADTFINLSSGEIVCGNCKLLYNEKLNRPEIEIIKTLLSNDFSAFSEFNFPDKEIGDTLEILNKNLSYRCDIKINSLDKKKIK